MKVTGNLEFPFQIINKKMKTNTQGFFPLISFPVHKFKSIPVNTLAPGRQAVFKLNWVIDGWGISGEITLRSMSLKLTDGNLTLVQVMAWCHQCWPRSMSPHHELTQWGALMHMHRFTGSSLVQVMQCLPFYIINEVGHLTTSVDHLAEFCQNYHLAAICTQLMVKFFLQLRFIQYFDCKCMKIPDFSRIDTHFVA